MASSKAATVDEYLAELPEERRAVISAVRDVVAASLPEGYVETMNWGMISYEVPLARYPVTYNKQPLMYAALAAQKNFYAVYLLAPNQDAAKGALLKAGFERAGKKLDAGKSCIRFRSLADLPLDAVAESIAGTSVDEFIAAHERGRSR
jgi:uncharacterized protein YdhG (YjbR/CyaY superfamily)